MQSLHIPSRNTLRKYGAAILVGLKLNLVPGHRLLVRNNLTSWWHEMNIYSFRQKGPYFSLATRVTRKLF